MFPLDQIKLYTLPIVCTASFAAGLYISHVFHGYRENQNLKEVQTELVRQNVVSNKSIQDLQTKLETLSTISNTVKEQLHETPIVTPTCKLTPAVVRLWNKSVGIEASLPTDTSGTASDSTPIAGVEITLEDAFQDKFSEDEEYNKARERSIALNKWVKEIYGTK